MEGRCEGPGNSAIPPANLVGGGGIFTARQTDRGNSPNPAQLISRGVESLAGRLAFSHTSVFGMFGRRATHPIYRKLHAAIWKPELFDSDVMAFQWWA